MGRITVADINERYPNEPEWEVTVHCDDYDDFTCQVRSPREGLARTNAMFLYPHHLNGQHITYTMRKLED